MLVTLSEGVRVLATLASEIEPVDLKCDMTLKFTP